MAAPNSSPVEHLQQQANELKTQVETYQNTIAVNLVEIKRLKEARDKHEKDLDELNHVLCDLIIESGAGDRDEMRVTIDNIKAKFDEFQQVGASQLQERDNEIKSLTEQLQLRDTEVQSLTEKLQLRDTEVKSLTDKLQERDNEIKSLTEKLQVRDTEVQSLTEKLQLRDTEVQSLTEQLQLRDTEVQSLTEQLQVRDAEVQSLTEKLQVRDTEVKSLIEKLQKANHEIGTLKVLGESARAASSGTDRSGSSGPLYDSQSPRAKAARRMLNGETDSSRNHPELNFKDVHACQKQKLMNKIKNAENDLANLQIELDKMEAAPDRRADLKRAREVQKEYDEAERKIKNAKKQQEEMEAKANAVIQENEKKLEVARKKRAELA